MTFSDASSFFSFQTKKSKRTPLKKKNKLNQNGRSYTLSFILKTAKNVTHHVSKHATGRCERKKKKDCAERIVEQLWEKLVDKRIHCEQWKKRDREKVGNCDYEKS